MSKRSCSLVWSLENSAVSFGSVAFRLLYLSPDRAYIDWNLSHVQHTSTGGPRFLLITDVLTDAWHLCKEPLMYQRANTHRCCGYLLGWCWGCCRGCCSRAAESRVGCSQWAPSWLPACSWGWSTGCKGWWSWWGFRSCWTARAKKHNCTRYTHWSQRESKENLLLNVTCHLMRESVGLPRCQLLIIKGVAEYAAHHGDVLEEHKQSPKIYMRNTPLQWLQ